MAKSLPAGRIFSGKKFCIVVFSFCAILFSTVASAQLNYTQDVNNGCAPLTVNFTNTSSPPANYFRWTFGDGDTANTVNATHVFSSPGWYNIYLEGWDTTGGGMAYMGSYYGGQIQVNGSLGAFSFSTGATACPGETISYNYYGQFNSLKWDFGDGSPQQTWNGVKHTYDDTGTYNVTLYLTTSCDTDTIIQAISINNGSVPYLSIQSNQNPVCPGDTVYFYDQNNYQAASYLWNFGDGNNSSLELPAHSFGSTGNYQVILTATNICGNLNSDTLAFNVQNGIYPSTGTNIWPNSACPYTPINFLSNASGTSFSWDFGDNATSSLREDLHFYTDTGTYPVELIITNGCGNSDTLNYSITVQYDPGNKPDAQVNFEGFWDKDTLTICPGEEVDLRNSSWSNYGTPLFYSWDFGDGDSSDAKHVSHVFSSPDTFTVQMIASNICGGKDTAFLWVIASNSTLPESDLQAFPPSFGLPICPGESVIFIDDGNKDNTDGLSYSVWYGDGDSTLNITNPEFFIATHTYPDTGNFVYTFEVTNSCGNSLSVNDTVNVFSSLDTFITFADNTARPDSMWDNSKCPGDTVQFFAGFGISYLWDFGDGTSDTNQFPQHIYNAPGTYDAQVIIINACGDTDTAFTSAEIKNTNKPGSWFDSDKEFASVNDTVYFYYGNQWDGSLINFSWDFGDGTSSTVKNPSHSYQTPGIYIVTLTAANNCGSGNPNSKTITVVSPVADFSFAFSNNGCTPEMVQFINLSLYADSFKWDFGDFSPSEFIEDPSHAYGWASVFLVTLTAYNYFTGDSDIITKPIIITQTPMPGWANFWPDQNPVCPGDEVSFNSMMFPSPASVKWFFGDGDSSQAFSPSHSYADTGGYSVTYIAYNSCGSDTSIQLLNVDSSAPIFAGFFANPMTACPGQQVSFSNFTFPDPISSLWYFGDGDSATSFNAAHAYSDTGSYTVTLIAYSSCNSDTITSVITMDTTLIPGVSATQSTDTACIDDMIGFSGNGTDLVSFNWNFDDGFSSLQQNPSHSFDSNGTYNVIFTGTNFCGNSNSDTVTVSIIDNAPPNAVFSANPISACGVFSNICPGANVYFTNYSINSAGNEWDFGDGFTSADINPVHAYADTGNYNVRLIATSSCGGKDTLIQCVRVGNDAIPSAFFCYSPICFNTPVCYGTEVSFTNFSSDTTDVLWDFGDGSASVLANPKHIFADTGTYAVVLRIANNCGNMAYFTRTITVTNTVSPNADLFAFPNPVCPGENVNFNIFNISTASYFWDFADGDTITSSAVNISHSFDTSGNYNVMMVAINGCGSDTNYLEVNIKQGTLAVFSFDTVCSGDTTHFADASYPAPSNWAWDFGNGNTSTSQNPSHLYSSPGIYSASLTVSQNGCVDNAAADVNVIDISLSASGTDVSCNGLCDGLAIVSPANGIAPYLYLWSNGQSDSTATGLCPGNYSATITDATGCTDTISIAISEPPAISYASVVAGLICFGTTDGSVDLQPASAFYTYNWSNGLATEDISGLGGGTYYVTVTDTNSCFVIDSFLIEETAVFALTMNITGITCNGNNDGTAAVSVTGTTTPFTYAWSNSSTTASIDSLSAGTYYLTVTDSNGCTVFDSAIIAEPAILNVSVTGNDAACNGAADGDAAAIASGGVTPYSYAWSDASTVAANDSLMAGTYSVTATDANGCAAIDSVTISEPTVLTLSVTGNDVSCNGEADGDATAAAGGGISPYSYLWSDASASAINDSLVAGVYSVTVTDANGCTIVDSVTLSEPATLSVSVTGNNVNCNGGIDGDATATASGGTSPYSYIWSDASTSEMNSSLAAGAYSVTVTDANGCTSTDSIIISEPDVLLISVTGNDVSCNGGTDGTATASATGGAPPYSYAWSDASTAALNDSLMAGSYSVTVTDINGCTAVDSMAISEPTALTVSVTGNDAGCNGAADGNATVTASGGTSSYSYLWNDTSTAPANDSLMAGIYSVTVTDANGCTSTGSVTISEPAALTISVNGINTSCNGAADGNATVTASGGTSPFSYVWNDASTAGLNDSLMAGTYSVTVTDANGCIVVDSIAISEPTTLTVSVSANNISCNGENNGDATSDAIGGTSPYSYVWSNGSALELNDSLAAGSYSVTVSDANGCSAVDSITISEPVALSATVSGNDASCNGETNGDATVTASGGTSPYSYLWSDASTFAVNDSLMAGTYSATITDANGCFVADSVTISEPAAISITVSSTDPGCGNSDGEIMASASGGAGIYTYLWSNGQTSATITGLPAGTYTVTATDSSGCFSTGTVNLSNSGAPILTIAAIDISCNGAADGSIDLSVTGGTSPYSYLWSNSEITQDLSNLSPGNYSVTVTDNLSCIAVISAGISEPAALSAIVYSTGISCFGSCDATVGAMVTGGTSPYSYAWSNGSVTQSMTGMCAGNYSVTVTDSNGCIATDSGNLSEPSALSSSATANDASCNSVCDGEAAATAAGGTSPYAYSWSDGQTSATAAGLCAGNYAVTITDFNGCVSTSSATVSEPALLIASASGNDVSCNGGNDGGAAVSANGGNTPYAYLWSDGSVTATNDSLTAGGYLVTVTDANGCTAVDSITISEPAALSAVGSATDVTCNGGNDGTAGASVSGGISPYTYSWNNGATSASLSGLAAGTYSVTVTDYNGCNVSESAIVNEAPAIVISASTVNPACGTSDGEISVAVSGGTSPYSYLWNNSSTTQTITGLSAGSYSLTVTDANGCTQASSVSLSNTGAPTLSVSVTDVLCNGEATGAIDLGVTGGTTPYAYSWDNSETTEDISSLTAGSYSVSVTDALSCIAVTTATVDEPAAITASLAKTDASCSGICNGNITLSISGGTSPYSYLWNDGSSSPVATGLCAGIIYSYTITDANGCVLTDSSSVSEPVSLALAVTASDATCNNACNGAATINITGGTSPFTYNWSNGDASATPDSLCAGNYSVTVTDANGCPAIDSAIISEPGAISLSVSAIDISCNGLCNGSANASVSGGITPYSYLWSNGQVSPVDTGLCAGNYSILVTDANNCVMSDSVTISEPAILSISETATNAYCGMANGTATATVSGGTSPFGYLWSDGQTSDVATGLVAGTFSITVTDFNGCFITAMVAVNNDSGPTHYINSTNVNCNGVCDGAATVVTAGGFPPFSFIWSTGDIQQTIDSLCTGTYSVTVEDSAGCLSALSAVITEPAAIVLTISTTNAFCGVNDGTATVSATGGTPPYSYLWSNGQTTASSTGLAVGTYSVTVTDSAGCDATATVTISQSIEITLALTATPDSGSANGTATASASGGTPPYSYLWENLQTDSTATGLSSGYYSVEVTDINGCTAEDSIEVPLYIGLSPVTDSKFQFSVYPNPVRGELKIFFKMPSSETMQITLFNTLGQETEIFAGETGEGEQILNFDTGKLSTGVFYLRVIIGNNKTEHIRFVKEN